MSAAFACTRRDGKVDEMLRIIRAHPEGITMREVRSEVEMTPNEAKVIIVNLHNMGLVRKVGKRCGSTLWGIKNEARL